MRRRGRTGGLHVNARAGDQAQLAVRHHALARVHALPHHRGRPEGEGDLDGTRLDGRVRLHDEDVLPLLAGLNRLRGHHEGIELGAHRQRDGGELPGPERVVHVVEGRLELDRAGRHVHGVVDEAERAARRDRLPLRGRRDRERPFAPRRLDLLEEALGHREDDVDRVHAVDDHERIADVVGLDDVALVDEQVARPPLDRRPDRRVAQLDLGVVHGRRVGLHERLLVRHHGTIGVHRGQRRLVRGEDLVVLLARDQAALHELLVALFFHARVVGLRLVAREVGLGLRDRRLVLGHGRLRLLERRLEGPRVYREEKIARLHLLPFGEMDLEDLPAQKRVHGHGGGRLDVADALDLHGHVAGLDGGRGDGHGRPRGFGLGLLAFAPRAGAERQHRDANRERRCAPGCHRRATAAWRWRTGLSPSDSCRRKAV